jgi:hypothetical protein
MSDRLQENKRRVLEFYDLSRSQLALIPGTRTVRFPAPG